MNRSQRTTGWRGYLSGSSGQRMNVLWRVVTYFGGAAHRWQRLSGNGRTDRVYRPTGAGATR